MKYSYLVLGSGMQGVAAGYHLAKYGDASRVTMADRDPLRAKAAASRLNALFQKDIASDQTLDVTDPKLSEKLCAFHGVLSATSYEFNEKITRDAISAKICAVDLGGNTDVVRAQLKMHESALAAGISIVPDCGLAPGLGNSLAALGIERMDRCDEVQIRCGGLPQNPKPPLGYKLVFSVRGLTNEYFGKAWVLRNGEVTEIDTFSELEEVDFPGMGKLEAFTTTGGASTCPWTFQGKVRDYNYKTIRYPGHFEKMKCMLDLGLLDQTPVDVGAVRVSPREVFHTVVPSHIAFPEDRDLVLLSVECKGQKNGQASRVRFEMIDRHDEATGFTAMERSTAFPASLVLEQAVAGRTKRGVVPLEMALENQAYLDELRQKGLEIREN